MDLKLATCISIHFNLEKEFKIGAWSQNKLNPLVKVPLNNLTQLIVMTGIHSCHFL